MTLAEAIALLEALNSTATVITKIVEDLQAKGHPADAPLPPEHQVSITAAIAAVANASADAQWDADHASSGG